MNTIKRLNEFKKSIQKYIRIIIIGRPNQLILIETLKKFNLELSTIIRYTLKSNRIKMRIRLNKSKK